MNITTTRPATSTPPGVSQGNRSELQELRRRRDELEPSVSKTAFDLALGGTAGAVMGAAAGAAIQPILVGSRVPSVSLGRAAAVGAVLGGVALAAAACATYRFNDSSKLDEVNREIDEMTG